MKKIIFAATLFAAITFNVSAQDEEEAGIGAGAGDVTAEFSLTGGGFFVPTFNLNNNLLRFRYFFADDMAARIGFGITRNSTKTIVTGPNNEEGTIRTSTGSINLNLGVEKHFSGTERLSPYAGADLLISLNSEKSEGEDVAGGVYSAGSTFENKGFGATGANTAGTGIGLRLVGGADFYFLKQVFFGAEFGWGFMAMNNKDLVTESTTGGTTTTTTTPIGSSFSIAPSVIGNLRIGFVF